VDARQEVEPLFSRGGVACVVQVDEDGIVVALLERLERGDGRIDRVGLIAFTLDEKAQRLSTSRWSSAMRMRAWDVTRLYLPRGSARSRANQGSCRAETRHRSHTAYADPSGRGTPCPMYGHQCKMQNAECKGIKPNRGLVVGFNSPS
jgi:hypothetical protein